mgnify:CR=1 FL=1
MQKETGLYLDGHRLEPVRINTYPTIDEDAGPGDFEQYRVVVGVLTLHFFLDASSAVKIDSTAYLDLEIDEDNDDDNHTWVILKNSYSYRDSFTGNCTLDTAVTNSCTVVNSHIGRSSIKSAELHPLVNLKIISSSLDNATLSDGTVVINSSIVNSTVYTEGQGAHIEGSTLKNASLSSKGILHLEGCKFNDTSIHAINFVRIIDSRLNGIYLKIDDCHIPNRLYFFPIEFPNLSLYCYQTGSDELAITRQGGGFDVPVDDPAFKKKLTELLIDCELAMPDDILDYITDCINSRKRIIQVLWAEFERTLGDPI